MIFNFFKEIKQTEEGERERPHELWDPSLAAPENHLKIFKNTAQSHFNANLQ